MQEGFSLNAEQRKAFAVAHMNAEVELAIEDPEYRDYLVQAAARASTERKRDYYKTLFAEVERREQALEHSQRHGETALTSSRRARCGLTQGLASGRFPPWRGAPRVAGRRATRQHWETREGTFGMEDGKKKTSFVDALSRLASTIRELQHAHDADQTPPTEAIERMEWQMRTIQELLKNRRQTPPTGIIEQMEWQMRTIQELLNNKRQTPPTGTIERMERQMRTIQELLNKHK